MATRSKNTKDVPDPRTRGGIEIEARGRIFDAVSMMEALSLLIEPRGIAAEAHFHGARVDSRGRVTLIPALPPASARLGRVRAWRSARSFVSALGGAGIPATLVRSPPEAAQSGETENS